MQVNNVGSVFPAVGMRVLAVDNDATCLMLLAKLLQKCKHHVTAVCRAEEALEMLRERRHRAEDRFHLVITTVHMPGMDGFKLLRLISVEMSDVPVIMLSANGEFETMVKGLQRGASDYLIKSVHIKEVKNLWKHVVRKGRTCSNSGNVKAGQNKLQTCAIGQKECVDNENAPTKKKQRINWSGALHDRFVEVVNQIGIENAVPKKGHKVMKVEGLTREHVSSHLQKYQKYLNNLRLGTVGLSSPLATEPMWNKLKPSLLNNGAESSTRRPEIFTSKASSSFTENSTSSFGTQNNLVPPQSMQYTSGQLDFFVDGSDMGPVGWEAREWFPSSDSRGRGIDKSSNGVEGNTKESSHLGSSGNSAKVLLSSATNGDGPSSTLPTINDSTNGLHVVADELINRIESYLLGPSEAQETGDHLEDDYFVDIYDDLFAKHSDN